MQVSVIEGKMGRRLGVEWSFDCLACKNM